MQKSVAPSIAREIISKANITALTREIRRTLYRGEENRLLKSLEYTCSTINVLLQINYN